MHEDFSNINLTDLFDMLAEQTDRYMRMLSGGASKIEFNSCREMIIDIQTEIQQRHAKNEEKNGSQNLSPG